MEIKIDLAGTILRISAPEGQLFTDPGMLAPFLTDSDRVDREVICAVADSFPEPPEDCLFHDASRWVYLDGDSVISYMGAVENAPDIADIWACRNGKSTEIRFKREIHGDCILSGSLLYGLEAECLIVRNRGFLFHCSYIEYEGGAILFTAPSGTGKSTQAELWRRCRNAKVINGDRAAVRQGEHGFEAWGVPFSGSSGISHRSRLPLRAIVYLSQAPETEIRPLNGVQAFRKLWEGCSLHTWDREDVAICSETVMKAAQQVPVFHLSCTPDETAVLALEQTLKQIQR